MNLVLFFLVLINFSLCGGGGGDHKPEDPIPAEFYAPWCGHCKKLSPEMEVVGAALENIKKQKHNAVVAKINCDEYKSICSKHGVSGYPTLKFFKKGSSDGEKYTGERTSSGIIDYLNEHTSARITVPKEVTYAPELGDDNFDETVMDPKKDVLVKFYAPWCGHCKKLTPEYEKAAKALMLEEDCELVSVDATIAKKMGEKYEVTGYPTLKFFSKDNKEPEPYQGDRTGEGLLAFMNKKCGTDRDINGGLSNTAGIFSELNVYILKYRAAAPEVRDVLKKNVEKTLETIEGEKNQKYSKFYLKAMKKIDAKGNGWVETEIARLEKLLKKDVKPSLADYMVVRINILNVFE